MNYKKKINKWILTCICFFLAAFLFMLPCYPSENYRCDGKYMDLIGQPIGISALVLLITFLLLRWLPESVYIAWKKFAKGFLPLAVLLILITGTSGGGMAPDREGVLYFLSAVYGFITVFIILITLVILCIKKLKNKR